MEPRAAEIAARLGGTAASRGFLVRCPCPTHGQGRGDRHPSLYIEDGFKRLLVCCYAGCATADVLKALPTARTASATPPPPNSPKTTTEMARRIWSLSKPITGTPAAAYAAQRGLTGPYPSSLRYMPPSPRYPRHALVAALTDADNHIVAAHLTYVDPDQPWRPGAFTERRVIGPAAGASVRFGRIAGDVAGVAEGNENAWSAFRLFNIPTLAATTAERIAMLRLPACVKRVVFFGDPDKAGRLAREKFAAAHSAIDIEDRFAPEGSDWNLELLHLARAA